MFLAKNVFYHDWQSLLSHIVKIIYFFMKFMMSGVSFVSDIFVCDKNYNPK